MQEVPPFVGHGDVSACMYAVASATGGNTCRQQTGFLGLISAELHTHLLIFYAPFCGSTAVLAAISVNSTERRRCHAPHPPRGHRGNDGAPRGGRPAHRAGAVAGAARAASGKEGVLQQLAGGGAQPSVRLQHGAHEIGGLL